MSLIFFKYLLSRGGNPQTPSFIVLQKLHSKMVFHTFFCRSALCLCFSSFFFSLLLCNKENICITKKKNSKKSVSTTQDIRNLFAWRRPNKLLQTLLYSDNELQNIMVVFEVFFLEPFYQIICSSSEYLSLKGKMDTTKTHFFLCPPLLSFSFFPLLFSNKFICIFLYFLWSEVCRGI